MVCMESTLPKCLPNFGTLPGGTDHGYIVCNYQLPMRAIKRGLRPLQRRGHCLFALLAEMAEHADGEEMRKRLEVELPDPTLDVSYSRPTLPLL